MSLGFYGGRPLIPQGMVPVIGMPGSNASLLGTPPGQVRPLLGQQVQMHAQPGAALPPGIIQQGLLGQPPPGMMGARMPGQMLIPGQEEAMPPTSMAGLDPLKQEPTDPSTEEGLSESPPPTSLTPQSMPSMMAAAGLPPGMSAGVPPGMAATSPPLMGQAAGLPSSLPQQFPPSVQQVPGAGVPGGLTSVPGGLTSVPGGLTSVPGVHPSVHGSLPASVHSLHGALAQAVSVQSMMAPGSLPASVQSMMGHHHHPGAIPGHSMMAAHPPGAIQAHSMVAHHPGAALPAHPSLLNQGATAMTMGGMQAMQSMMATGGAIPGMVPGQPGLPAGVPGFIPGGGQLVTMGMGLPPQMVGGQMVGGQMVGGQMVGGQMVGGALPAGMALPPGYAAGIEAAYSVGGEAGLIKQEEYEEEPPIIDESNPPAQLDSFNSDLNLKIEQDGYTAESVTEPMGFCFCWAGARATYGVTSGKACFEVKITKHLPVDFGEEHKEQDPHVMRLGWAADSASYQLGEVAESYGYGGTGRFSVNMKFKNYGNVFGKGDVITALLDLNPRNPTIAYCKNGTPMGIAQKLKSCETTGLFPAILLKNVRVECNFGQRAPWFPPPEGYSFIDHMPAEQKVRGMLPPERQQDCELIMIVGLPGAGKTTWGLKMQEEHFDKRYNIIGTDTLIEKMRVNGLPRKNNYHGRWEVLISKATACLNTLFSVGSKLNRNYILDQTNVYASARRRKLRNFYSFRKILAVIQPDNDELKRREYKRTYEDGKFVPEDAVNEMKSNFTLPSDGDEYVDETRWIELDRSQCVPLVDMYNRVKGPRGDHNRGRGGGRGGYGGHDNRKRYGDYGDNRSGAPPQGYGPPGEKKMRQEGDRSGLDYIKQEYDDKGNPEGQGGQWSRDGNSRPPGDGGYGGSYGGAGGRGYGGQQGWNQSGAGGGLKPGENPWGQDGNQTQSTWQQQQRDQGQRWQQGESPSLSGSLLGAPPPPPPQGAERGGSASRYDDNRSSSGGGQYSGKEESKSYRDDRHSSSYRDDKSWDRRGGASSDRSDRSSSGRYQSDRDSSSRGSSGGGGVGGSSSSSWQQKKPWEKQEDDRGRSDRSESGSRYSRDDRGRDSSRSGDGYRSQSGGGGSQWNQGGSSSGSSSGGDPSRPRSGDRERGGSYSGPDTNHPPPPPKDESSRDPRGASYGRDERSSGGYGYGDRGRGDDRQSNSWSGGNKPRGDDRSDRDYGKSYSGGSSSNSGSQGRYGNDQDASKSKDRYDSYYDDQNGDDLSRDKKSERKSRWDTSQDGGGGEDEGIKVKEEEVKPKVEGASSKPQPEVSTQAVNSGGSSQQREGGASSANSSSKSKPPPGGSSSNNVQGGGPPANGGPGILGQYGGPGGPMGSMQELVQRPPPGIGGGGGPGGPGGPMFGGPGGPPGMGGGGFPQHPPLMRGPPPSLMNAPPPRGGMMNKPPDRFHHPGGPGGPGGPPGFGGGPPGRGGFPGGRGPGHMGGRGGFRGRGGGFGGPRGGGFGGPPRGGGFHRGGRGGMF